MWLGRTYGSETLRYCTPGPEFNNLIYRTHVANYVKDITIFVLSAIRVIYFFYVLIYVCRRKSPKPFFKRPTFLNWLPILTFVSSAAVLYFNYGLLVDTIQGEGQVICELDHRDFYYTIAASYLTGLYHYTFCAEFLNTSIALQTIIEGLAIACSNFVRSKS